MIGQFVPTGRLVLKYAGQQVADLAMEFLHDGRPPVVRDAVYAPLSRSPFREAPGEGVRTVASMPAVTELRHLQELCHRRQPAKCRQSFAICRVADAEN